MDPPRGNKTRPSSTPPTAPHPRELDYHRRAPTRQAHPPDSSRHMSNRAPPFPQNPRPRFTKRALESLPQPSVHQSLRSLGSFVSHWLESIGSDPKKRKRSRSESCIHPLLPASRVPCRPKSLPDMNCRRDADGFAIPPPPSSRRNQSMASLDYPIDLTQTMSSNRQSRALVQTPKYRDQNLELNGVFFLRKFEPFPEHVQTLVEYIGRARQSPRLSQEELDRDLQLLELQMGVLEADVEVYFRETFHPLTRDQTIVCTNRLPMLMHTIPTMRPLPKISKPVPDMLYGYHNSYSFSPQQRLYRASNSEVDGTANSAGLVFPFLVIEFKADGPSGAGSLWQATNQCLGAASSCVNIIQGLNVRLEGCCRNNIKRINTSVFSIAMSGTEARLYVSWKHDKTSFYTRVVRSFLIHDADHYWQFRNHVHNIIDWGRSTRLDEIRRSLDVLLEAENMD
ncbi:hypothetical protein L249_1772 [Ophiocordyceps polyrhachis-furcata BCC 54312]|uniref:DUF7924 domain-containing protein n=1 Tax=Ophiocordyceps polyrhachis-furcata BCC 54312 TaxID=1330021 RepID=A0A367LR21_9HYPO|nr:hypothetical protein L249_1772 [Ophiocordyceps polyrhachis-furcata BCC 54312]